MSIADKTQEKANIKFQKFYIFPVLITCVFKRDKKHDHAENSKYMID